MSRGRRQKQGSSLLEGFSARALLSTSIAALLLWLLCSIAVPKVDNFQLRLALLRAEAKCPGLPFGQNSGGPDYINIAIDVALGVVAAVFIYLTVRDIRRRRKLTGEKEGEVKELDGSDDL